MIIINKISKIILFEKILCLFLIISLIPKKYVINNKNSELNVSEYIKNYKKNNLSQINFKYFEKEIPFIINYVKLLRENLIIDNNLYFKIINPKITFIATVFNKEKYLKPFIYSIKNQLLKHFELIIVDDNSKDNSIQIINEFMKKDKRIKLIQNKNNRGSLYARYIGAIHAKGEYIIFVDSDDIILKNGIEIAYNFINNNNLDMIQFHSVFELKGRVFISRRYYKYLNVIYQPILSNIFYYDKYNGCEKNTALWDKLIKKETVLKSLKFIGNKYLKDKIIIENDVILLYSLFQNCKSYKYIDEIVYYYVISNNDSITNTKYKPEKADQIIHSIFTNINFLYEKTENSYFGKYFCIFKLFQGWNRYEKYFTYLKDEFNLMEKVLNKLLISNFISRKNKLLISTYKSDLMNYKKKLKRTTSSLL